MHSVRAGGVAWVLVIATLTFVGPPPAAADGCPPGQVPQAAPWGGTICVPATDPGTPGDPGGPGDNSGGGGGNTCPSAPDGQCINEQGGVWMNPPGAYCYRADPQPPADHYAWDGHEPSEGSIYECSAGASLPISYVFVANGQAPLPDPRELAQRALEQLELAVPDIHIAPHPPLATYVGLETWLWLPEAQWDSLSLTVTAGATSVTVTARPARVDWDLTEGTTSCVSAGRPWQRGMSDDARTDCSYTFLTLSDGQSDGRYAVSATIAYAASWTCSGACLLDSGDLGEVPSLTSNDGIEVDERQSVVVR
jgi:hypothetical protein